MSDYQVALSEDEMHILLRAMAAERYGKGFGAEARPIVDLYARLFQMQAAKHPPSERLIGRIEQTLDDQRQRVRDRQQQRLRDLQEAFGAPEAVDA